MGKSNQPKSKCCVSKSRCNRCPIRMLKEGTLPDGYTVKKRKLVKTTPLVAAGLTSVLEPVVAGKKAGKRTKKSDSKKSKRIKTSKQPIAA